GEDLAEPTKRLLREAQMLAQVAHPNVVAVHDVGTYEDQVFLAMDFVEGQTLREWSATPRQTREIIEVFVQAGRGLAAAHAAGVVHRDFKPDNVLVGKDGRVVVTDFGLAREDAAARDGATDDPARAAGAKGAAATARASNARIAGTPAYMAPEQLRGDG